MGVTITGESTRRLTFGSSSRSHVPLVARDGTPYPWISEHFGEIWIRSGQAYISNISATHQLAYRRWGAQSDIRLPTADVGESATTLGAGLWWVRNSRMNGGREPLDHEVAWMQVAVLEDPIERQSGRSGGTAPLQPEVGAGSLPPLREKELRTFARIFVEFLSFPPRVHPVVRSDAELKREFQQHSSQRRSELRQAAREWGYRGSAVDSGFAAWMLDNQVITFRDLESNPETRALLGIPKGVQH